MPPAPDDALERFMRYDELRDWLEELERRAPEIMAIETYGRSHEGRDLLLVTVTDTATGSHDAKPAHWVDAAIHSVELTATVAACHLLAHLVDGHLGGDPEVTEALRTRTFYVVPRVNPDGAEWALADRPRFRRSSTRAWPWRDGQEWPGLVVEDVDADGRILQMRIADPDGAWIPHPDDARLLVPVPPHGPPDGAPRYRLLQEGSVVDHDGFTIPTPRPVEGLDLNRNFPAGWGTEVNGSGDHPLSEPEVDALVRAIVARPNICGYNAFHTSGGVLLRPSSTQPDSKLPPGDRWAWTELGAIGTALTGYPVHSVYEDFTWDTSATMSGAADDWAYEHLGIFGWTTEFWDVVHAATGTKASTLAWYTGPTDAQALAVLRWCDANHPDGYVDWYPFEHPQLGRVELGGWDDLHVWINPPSSRLRAEVAGHATFAVRHALSSPRLEIRHLAAIPLGGDPTPDQLGAPVPTVGGSGSGPEAARDWRLELGLANTGWLPTQISERAARTSMVLPIVAEVTGAEVRYGQSRVSLGQLAGRATMRFTGGHDGTPDRVLTSWTLRAVPGTTVRVTARHPRAGKVSAEIRLGS